MQSSSAPALVQLFPLIFIMIIFYFLLLRPQQKKQKEHKLMVEGMKKNDELVTVGGMHGTVVNIKEKTFIIRVGDDTKIEKDKTSVAYLKRRRES